MDSRTGSISITLGRNNRNMSFDLSMDPSKNPRTRSYLTRRGSIKKEFNPEKPQMMDISLTQIPPSEVGKKKLKTVKEKKTTIKNSYINGIKKLANCNTSSLEGLTKRGLKHIQKNPTENVSIRK